jgi:hypothetical protein
MTDTAAQTTQWTLADALPPVPVFALAAVGLVVGYWWLPAWFLAAQLVRLWSSRGGVRWLSSLGVAEYTDEKYAAIIGYAPVVLIGLRLFLSINWLESFQVINSEKLPTGPNPQDATYLAVVLGFAVAAALSGVLLSRGLPWLIAAAGFALVLALAIGASGPIWQANALQAAPLMILGYLVSKVPLTIIRTLDRLATRRAEASLDDSDATTESRSHGGAPANWRSQGR